MGPNVSAPVGHAEAQARDPPATGKVKQRLHFAIVLSIESYFGASNGQFH
jgi:hypothetical protein